MRVTARGLAAAAMVAALLGLSGCAGLVTHKKTISISSKPSGAAVYANGAKVGETPLAIVPDQVFPPRFVGMSYRAAGTLAIRKAGCEEYTSQVNDYVLSKDIHVQLKCDPNYHPPAAQASPGVSSASGKPGPGTSDKSIAFRLRRLEALHKDGLITDQEYHAIRKRILSGL